MKLKHRTGAGILGAALALAAAPASGAAQIPLNPRALGVGGAYVGVARGHEAVFSNPANLGLPGAARWSLGFPQVAAGATVLGPELLDLRDYFNYDDLSDQQRTDLLAKIPAGGTALEAEARAPLVTWQMGNFGLGVAYGFLGAHTIGRDLVDLFLNGYDEGRTDYRIGNTGGTRATYWDFAAAYGRSVGPLSIGATAHYYLGRGLVQTRAFEPRYDLVDRDIEIDYVGVSSKGGSGYGLDLGAALQPMPGLTLSAAVANVVHSMEWSDELRGRSVTLTGADFFDSEFQVIRSRYDRSEQDLGDTPGGRFATVAEGLTEEAKLPTTLRLGAAYTLPGGTTTLTGAFHDDLTEGQLSGRWSRLVGAGVQQKLPVGTIRAGYSTDADAARMLAGGVTLGPVDLALAHFTNGEENEATRNGWIGSFGLSLVVPWPDWARR